MHTVPVYVPMQSQGDEWRHKFPYSIVALIGIIQMFVTWGILACETLNMLSSIAYGFLFIGYGTSFFFTLTWISIYGGLCCRGRCCSTYILVMEILSFCFSIVLLVFDIIVLNNPYRCIFDYVNYSCNPLSLYNFPSWSLDGSLLSITEHKIPAIKGQLAGAVLMLVTALLYIVVYIITVIRIHRSRKSNRSPMAPQFQTVPPTMNPRLQQTPLQMQGQFYQIPDAPYFQQQHQVSNPQYHQAVTPQYPVIKEPTRSSNSYHMATAPLTSTKF